MIGRGSVGSVYKIVGNQVIKVVEKTKDDHLEVEALELFRGKDNIVKLRASWSDTTHLYMVFPRYTCDMHWWISNGRPLDKRRAIFQVINGLREIHDLGYFHRDIKPLNVLIDHTGTDVVITDFGWTIPDVKGRLNTYPAYTVSFRAPEILKERSYNKSADIYAVAMLIFYVLNEVTVVNPPSEGELHLHMALFYQGPMAGTLRDFKRKCRKWDMSTEEFTMWKRCVNEQPEIRPSIHSLHKFFLQ